MDRAFRSTCGHGPTAHPAPGAAILSPRRAGFSANVGMGSGCPREDIMAAAPAMPPAARLARHIAPPKPTDLQRLHDGPGARRRSATRSSPGSPPSMTLPGHDPRRPLLPTDSSSDASTLHRRYSRWDADLIAAGPRTVPAASGDATARVNSPGRGDAPRSAATRSSSSEARAHTGTGTATATSTGVPPGPADFGTRRSPRGFEAVQGRRAGTSFGAPTGGEVELAIEVIDPSSVEITLMTSSGRGYDSSLRLARSSPGRTTIMKFAGSYHDTSTGCSRWGLRPHAVFPPARASPRSHADTVTSGNDRAVVEAISIGRPAAVLASRLPANMGVVPPNPGFLEAVRDVTRRFRLAVHPDR